MNSINNKLLYKVLDRLDHELKEMGISRELKVFGSGALILLNLSKPTRETTDLDMLSPTGDVEKVIKENKFSDKSRLQRITKQIQDEYEKI